MIYSLLRKLHPVIYCYCRNLSLSIIYYSENCTQSFIITAKTYPNELLITPENAPSHLLLLQKPTPMNYSLLRKLHPASTIPKSLSFPRTPLISTSLDYPLFHVTPPPSIPPISFLTRKRGFLVWVSRYDVLNRVC